jgi:hypothetical protein
MSVYHVPFMPRRNFDYSLGYTAVSEVLAALHRIAVARRENQSNTCPSFPPLLQHADLETPWDARYEEFIATTSEQSFLSVVAAIRELGKRLRVKTNGTEEIDAVTKEMYSLLLLGNFANYINLTIGDLEWYTEFLQLFIAFQIERGALTIVIPDDPAHRLAHTPLPR